MMDMIAGGNEATNVVDVDLKHKRRLWNKTRLRFMSGLEALPSGCPTTNEGRHTRKRKIYYYCANV